jgi:hypothetical protein
MSCVEVPLVANAFDGEFERRPPIHIAVADRLHVVRSPSLRNLIGSNTRRQRGDDKHDGDWNDYEQ